MYLDNILIDNGKIDYILDIDKIKYSWLNSYLNVNGLLIVNGD